MPKNKKGFTAGFLVLIICSIIFAFISLIFYFLFGIFGSSLTYNIETTKAGSEDLILLNYLRTPISLTQNQKTTLAELIALGEVSPKLKQRAKLEINRISHQFYNTLGIERTLRVTYPDKNEIELYRYGKPTTKVEIPSLKEKTITIELLKSKVDIKNMKLKAGDKIWMFGEEWVAWGLGYNVEYFSLDGCPCKTKVIDYKTICEDGTIPKKDPHMFIHIKNFNIKSAKRVISYCKKETEETKRMEQFADKIIEIVRNNKLGESVIDNSGNTWTYWGEYGYLPKINPNEINQFWTSKIICKCKGNHCPNDCNTVKDTPRTLKCEEDKNTMPPESVINNKKCFITTEQLLREWG